MQPALIALIALVISLLTFFSGFGLGTLLMPFLALFVPVDQAVAATAVAHLCNNLAKGAALGRRADRRVLISFGVPAVLAAFAGAWLLTRLGALPGVYTADWTGRTVVVTPLKLVAAGVILFFAAVELTPRWRNWSVPPRYMRAGGVLSGFFGGLSGHQGAFRTAFLLRAGLTKEAFIATGIVIACGVDVARLAIYLLLDVGALTGLGNDEGSAWRWDLFVAACIGAVVGSLIGMRLLKKVTLDGVRVVAAILMILIGVGLASGAI